MHTDDFDGFVVTINGTTHYVDGTVPDKTLNTVSDYNSLLRDMICLLYTSDAADE